MGHAVVDSLTGRVSYIHGAFLEVVGDLDEGSFRARPGAKAPSVAFHLWHTARWADAFQARFGSFAPQLSRFAGREQIWDARGLENAWGLGDVLGKEATGMGLDDDASAALPLPSRDEVVSYAREVFAAAEEVFGGIDESEFRLPTADFYDEGGWVVIDHFGWHLTHASRHLGMIEALKGVLGVEGTATV
jgi:DinB superfamily